MSKINDGGPAFPVDNASKLTGNGMSLRDWFAGQALAGLVSKNDYGGYENARSTMELNEFAASDSEEAYRIADAMLKERAQ